MPVNVEIKARVADAGAMRQRIETLCGTPPQRLIQEDLFFAAPRGRLKLRLLEDGGGELIHYHRDDAPAARPSHYLVFRTDAPALLRAALEGALGVTGRVRKQRLLFRYEKTRIHLDQVEGLGAFLELEVMLDPDETPSDGQRVAAGLMQRLGVDPSDLIGEAYVDLLQRGG
jgi:predicted adenylyl cyclase CyaB